MTTQEYARKIQEALTSIANMGCFPVAIIGVNPDNQMEVVARAIDPDLCDQDTIKVLVARIMVADALGPTWEATQAAQPPPPPPQKPKPPRRRPRRS
jgi:hypothetical protein